MKTGMIVMGVAALAAVGGIGYYLWSRGKQVKDEGFGAYGPAATDGQVVPLLRTKPHPVYSSAVPLGIKLTGLV
jgi:hypothetical protein